MTKSDDLSRSGLQDLKSIVRDLSQPSSEIPVGPAKPLENPEVAPVSRVNSAAAPDLIPDNGSGSAPVAPEIATEQSAEILGQKFAESELMIGLVGATGTELRRVAEILEARLRVFGYPVHRVQVSEDIIKTLSDRDDLESDDAYKRTSALMDVGDEARQASKDSAILALGVAAKIATIRQKEGTEGHRHAYIISSLKHPEEVLRLREIYPEAFYLIGVHADADRRRQYLMTEKRINEANANKLMERDEDEHVKHGQRTSDTFHMSDFFVRIDGDDDKLKNSLWRVLDILFGDPYKTPTFDEFAMFMAFAASLRSADLSRQVGAVVAKNEEIIATGANDCPRFGGGLYWPEYDDVTKSIVDAQHGRDYTRGQDANKNEQKVIIEDIIRRLGNSVSDKDKLRDILRESRIGDLTEFGRIVHAEMEALICCARNHTTTRGASLYCTTFPCHNCAKHIVAAGICRVVYVEPYPKSKAAEFHADSISLGFAGGKNTVRFEPFVGVGPRRFFDLFSMSLGSGYTLRRKEKDGSTWTWKPESAKLRIQMLPIPYLEMEKLAGSMFNGYRKGQGVTQ